MISDSIHKDEIVKKGDVFLRYGQKNWKLGHVISGVLRGYVIDELGNETTTHFFKENDMVFGNYIPNVPCSITIEAIEDCVLTTASFSEVMSYVNKNEEITEIIHKSFHKLNTQLQSRLIALSNLKSIDKYILFLKEYPGLLNRVPHYHIANFLGITPTQLSRARKEFSEK